MWTWGDFKYILKPIIMTPAPLCMMHLINPKKQKFHDPPPGSSPSITLFTKEYVSTTQPQCIHRETISHTGT